jgi:hypothetical protein
MASTVKINGVDYPVIEEAVTESGTTLDTVQFGPFRIIANTTNITASGTGVTVHDVVYPTGGEDLK